MTCNHPYMLRRTDCYYFRIKVPPDLRAVIGQREFTRSLKTGERARALPLALQLAAMAKHLFHALRHSKMSSGDLRQVLERAKTKLKLDELKESHEREIDDRHERRTRDMREAKLQAKIEALHQTIGQLPPAVQAALGKEKAQESDALAGALRRTLVVYRNEPAWPALMARGMAQDFSWAPAAEQYLALYRTMLQARGT